MGRQDVRRALVAMDEDDAVRERLASGDFGAVEGLELSSDEQLLVQDAASDMPEVSGFAAGLFASIGDIKGSVADKERVEIDGPNLGQMPWKWQTAVKYGLQR